MLWRIAVMASDIAPATDRRLDRTGQPTDSTSNVYRVLGQEALADRICALSGMQEVFFANSGSEANEAALKLVRMFGHKHGEPEAQTIVMERAWHGRTLATLAATGSEKARKGFAPFPTGFICVPYNDIAAVKRAADNDRRVRAVWSRCCRVKAASTWPISSTFARCAVVR